MEKQVPTTKRALPNKYVYVAFLLAAIFFVARKDFSTAIIFGGIGLAFDPFDQSVPFGKRPLWQKGWLLLHVIFVFVVLGASLAVWL